MARRCSRPCELPLQLVVAPRHALLRPAVLTRAPVDRFTYIEQQNLKVVEMFFQVDTDGNGELDVWEFEDALVSRRCCSLWSAAWCTE